MNLNHQEIQRILYLIYQLLLKADYLGEKQFQEGDRILDHTGQKNDKVTTSATPHQSDLVQLQENTDNYAYNESSTQDGTQIYNYLNQLGNLLNSEENSETSTNHQAENGLKPISELSQELTETSLKQEKAQFLDDSIQQSQSSRVEQSVKASKQSKDIENAGILEELIEQISLDTMDSRALEYEKFIEQLALDETEPKTVKELNQILSRLRDRVVEDNSDKSIAEELEFDRLLEKLELGDRISDPTRLEQHLEQEGHQLEFAELLEESGDRISDPTHLEQQGNELEVAELLEESGDRISDPTRLEPKNKPLKYKTERKIDTFSSLLSKLNLNNYDKRVRKAKKNRPAFLILSLATLSIIVLPWFIYQYVKTIKIEEKVTRVLDSYPSIAFYHIKADVQGKELFLTGKLPSQHLRDRAAAIAASTVPDLVVNNKIIIVDQPADMVQVGAEVEEIITILNQIDGINISAKFDRGQVILEGTSIQDITSKNITRIFEEVPGVRQVDNQIKIQPFSIAIRIYFNHNSTKIVEGDFEAKIYQIKELLQKYPHLKLKIIGYSHDTEESNKNIELQRAQAVETFLEDQGIDRRRIQVVAGKGSPPDIASNQDRWLSRCVVFEIIQSDLEHPEEKIL